MGGQLGGIIGILLDLRGDELSTNGLGRPVYDGVRSMSKKSLGNEGPLGRELLAVALKHFRDHFFHTLT